MIIIGYAAVRDWLIDAGFDVYPIGGHKGVCEAPYVVVKEDSRRAASISAATDIFDIMVYCPLGKYADVRPFLDSVMDALDDMPGLKNTNSITPAFIDDAVKAYMMSVKYINHKKRRDTHA